MIFDEEILKEEQRKRLDIKNTKREVIQLELIKKLNCSNLTYKKQKN